MREEVFWGTPTPMRISHKLGLLVLTLVISFFNTALADGIDVIEKSEEEYVYADAGCEQTDTCGLRSVIFRTEKYHMPPDPRDGSVGDFFGTAFYASIVTDTLEDLRNYAFVQFIRGCVFRSERLPSGVTEETFSVVRPYMDDGMALFRHDGWMIDSNEVDPIYSSAPSESSDRHYYAQWNEDPAEWKLLRGKLFGEEKPTHPRIYVDDHPMQAFVLGDVANNVSLEFSMCLFRTKDVPRKAAGNDIAFAAPLVCGEWEHKFIYDHTAGRFTRPKEMHPTCNRPLTPEDEARDRYIRENNRRRNIIQD